MKNEIVLGQFERITLVLKDKKKWVWLNDENLPGMKGAPLYMVVNEGMVEGEKLTAKEYKWICKV